MDAFERESLPPDGIPEPRSGASLANPCAVSLIAYATQNGLTEDLAFATREALGASGRAIEVLAFDELRVARLASAGGALLLTSTTGDGDPPDMAAGFAADCMRQPAALTSLR
ncbi:MAG TPA: flavodoxin domain-containing protein, partial [Rhodanobacteraceae bacterium]|nr:flavodoxin domain-containing protein [Rhodanobacteraceae bacterium]